MSKLIAGAIAGLLFGLLQKFLLGGAWDLLIFGAGLGALIGFVASKIGTGGTIGASALAGAGLYAVSALISGYVVMDHTITGAVTGLIIGALLQFVVPKITGTNNQA